MLMNNKFLSLYESVFQKYQRQGVLVGDYVKFIDKYKSHEDYKDLPENVKEMIKHMIVSGLNIRVVLTKPWKPAFTGGNTQLTGMYYVADIALDQGGGRLTDYTTVPVSLLVVDNDYPNLNKLAASQHRKDKVQIKPKEVEADEEFKPNLTDPGNGKLKISTVTNPKTNTVLSNQKPASPTPAVKDSYTKNYLSR